MPPVEETGLTISLLNMVRIFSATSEKQSSWTTGQVRILCTTKPRAQLLTEGILTSKQRVTGYQNSLLIRTFDTMPLTAKNLRRIPHGQWAVLKTHGNFRILKQILSYNHKNKVYKNYKSWETEII